MTADFKRLQRGRCRKHLAGNRRGVALVLVLSLLVILGGLGATVMTRARTTRDLVTNARARVIARFSAESGIEATRAAIDAMLAAVPAGPERDDQLNAFVRDAQRGDSLAMGDSRAVTVVLDPGTQLDVNAAPTQNLTTLLAYFTDIGRAADMASAIRSHIDSRNGSPVQGNVPFEFANPIRSLEELREVPGVDIEVLSQAVPYLTVDGDRTINQNMASDTVMAAAFGDLGSAPTRLVLVARGWHAGHPLTHEIQAVFAVAHAQLVLVTWRERSL